MLQLIEKMKVTQICMHCLGDQGSHPCGCGKLVYLKICNQFEYWWECKWVQLLWRIVWRFLKKLKAELPYDPAIPLLGMYLVKVKVKVAQWCPTLCDPMDYTIHGILQARILKWVTIPSPGDLPNPGIKPRSPALQADSLPAEPQGKPKNTGVGILSLLQQIFPTQELNWGLPHFRQILYQQSYQGSPHISGENCNLKRYIHFNVYCTTV